MGYTLHSKLLKDWESVASRFRSSPVIYAVCLAGLWVLLLLCYLGMLVAPTIVCGMTLQALHSFTVVFWISAALISVGILVVVYMGGRRILHEVRQRLIDVELAVGFSGFVLAAVVIAATLVSGFYFMSF
jgi:hypothetical protein